MNRILQLTCLMLIIFFIGCSEDNSTSPSVSIIIGTWYNTENENDVITFYPDGYYVYGTNSGTYSYLESEKKGSLRTLSNLFDANFEIIDDLLYFFSSKYSGIGGKTFRK